MSDVFDGVVANYFSEERHLMDRDEDEKRRLGEGEHLARVKFRKNLAAMFRAINRAKEKMAAAEKFMFDRGLEHEAGVFFGSRRSLAGSENALGDTVELIDWGSAPWRDAVPKEGR